LISVDLSDHSCFGSTHTSAFGFVRGFGPIEAVVDVGFCTCEWVGNFVLLEIFEGLVVDAVAEYVNENGTLILHKIVSFLSTVSCEGDDGFVRGKLALIVLEAGDFVVKFDGVFEFFTA